MKRQSRALRRQQEGIISSTNSSSASLWRPKTIIATFQTKNPFITKLGPHVIESVILLLDLFALHSVNDDLRLIVRSEIQFR